MCRHLPHQDGLPWHIIHLTAFAIVSRIYSLSCLVKLCALFVFCLWNPPLWWYFGSPGFKVIPGLWSFVVEPFKLSWTWSLIELQASLSGFKVTRASLLRVVVGIGTNPIVWNPPLLSGFSYLQGLSGFHLFHVDLLTASSVRNFGKNFQNFNR